MNRIFAVLAGCVATLSVASSAVEPSQPAREQAPTEKWAQLSPIILLIDANSGQILQEQDADRRFVPASITKVMSAFVAFEMIENGQLNPDQKLSMSEALAEDWYRTGSTMFLNPGEEVTVEQLLRGITSVSANDASAVLAVGAAGSMEAWVDKMNMAARRIGMQDSHFGTPNGWPDDGKTFTTAYDLALLGRILIARYPENYAKYFGQEGLRHNGFAQANHDPISGHIEGADGLKTGYTNQAGHGFLGSAQRDGTRLLMVVAGIDYEQQREAVSRELIEWGFEAFDRTRVFGKGEQVARVRVQNGARGSVALLAPNDIRVAISREQPVQPEFSVSYAGPVEAPVRAGQRVGSLQIRMNGELTASSPLIAAEDVAEARFFQRIGNAFGAWF